MNAIFRRRRTLQETRDRNSRTEGVYVSVNNGEANSQRYRLHSGITMQSRRIRIGGYVRRYTRNFVTLIESARGCVSVYVCACVNDFRYIVPLCALRGAANSFLFFFFFFPITVPFLLFSRQSILPSSNCCEPLSAFARLDVSFPPR